MAKAWKWKSEIGGLAAILAFAVALAMLLPPIFPFLSIAESRVADIRAVSFAPPATPRDDIVVVAITEQTLAQPEMPYRSPIDRARLAEWLEALLSKGARAVAFDLLFDQPTEAEKDARFARVVAGAGVPVVVAWGDPAGGELDLTERQAAFQRSYVGGARKGRPVFLEDAASVTRWIPGPIQAGADDASLALAPALAAALELPAPRDEMEIDYLGRTAVGTSPFPIYPAHLVAKLPAPWIRGKIVLVGADLPWEDRHVTPFAAVGGVDSTMAGVMIHAHALAQIIDGRRAHRAGPWLNGALALALAALGLVLALVDFRLWAKNGAAALAAALYWVGGFALAAVGGAVVALVMPTLGFAAAYGLANALLGRRLRHEKKEIRRAFAHYVAPAVVRRLEADPARLGLGGEARDLSYIFTDITDFTSLSESLPPTRLVGIVNDYFDGMTRIVLDHQGTVDKFTGDGLAALFNAPEAQPDHAARSVGCAIALDGFAQAFAGAQREAGIDFGTTRIGVHTGPAVVGNFGGRERFAYTAMGDMVNTAARLEGANRYLGTRVCISAATAASCADLPMRPVGELLLKGKSEMTPVFEPLPPHMAVDGAAEAYNAAYGLLRADDPRAESALRDLQRAHPDDTLIAFHVRRLAEGGRGVRIVLTEK